MKIAGKVGVAFGIILGIFIAIYAGAYLYESWQHSEGQRYSNSSPPSSTTTLISKERVISRGEISVSADSYRQVIFGVPQGAENPRVTGWFWAAGGSGNDIEVFVFDKEDCINWENGHWTGSLYSSGKITTGDFDISLLGGESYYIVYSNRFSWISDKRVDTDVVLTWKEYE